MSKRYTDSFDSSRELVPIQETPRGTECKVFFDGHYHGRTYVPRHLLVERPKNEREVKPQHYYGFVANKA